MVTKYSVIIQINKVKKEIRRLKNRLELLQALLYDDNIKHSDSTYSKCKCGGFKRRDSVTCMKCFRKYQQKYKV